MLFKQLFEASRLFFLTSGLPITRFPSLDEKFGFILIPHFVNYLPPFRVVNREYVYLCLLFVLLCLQAYFICLLTPITSGVIRVAKPVPKTSIFPLAEHQDMGRHSQDVRIIHMTPNTPYGVFGLTYISRIWWVRHFMLYQTYLLVYYVYFQY